MAKRTKRKDKVARVRLAIIAGVAVLAVAVAAVGLFYRGEDGEPYRVLEVPDGTGDVRVVAYFSFTCPHCRRLEELADDWAETLPPGVTFRRAHVAYSATNRLLAKGYLALSRHGAAAANRPRLFAAMQDRGRQFPTMAALADFVAGHGIERETFLRTANSPRIARLAGADEESFVAAGLQFVPALVVDDKYVINMALGRKEALATARALAEDLAAKRAATDSDPV